MLTARDDIDSRVRGLDSGADDYLVKPFSFAELLARMRALIRRGTPPRPTLLTVDELRLDPAARRVWQRGTELSLTAREFAMLELFMRHPGEVLSRFELLEHVWDDSYENRSNVIEVYVGYLRDKIGRDVIETVRGVGYRLRARSSPDPGARWAA
jgi:two-component system OmpR family response regulator